MNTKVNLPRCLVILMSGLGLLTTINAAVFFEEFHQPPASSDWRIHGDTALFEWNPAGHLDVTWDSTQTNSFFFHPLQSVLGKHDDFKIEFELTLRSIGYQSSGGPTTAFEIAIGLINTTNATDADFYRGGGVGVVRNLVEFDYFPDNGLGDTIWPAFWSTNGTLSYVDQDDFVLQTLPLNQTLAVSLDYNSTNETLTTTITADGQPFLTGHQLRLASSFTDFRVDAFAISSYELEGDSSLHAQGEIDNVRITYPLPVTNLAITRNDNSWTSGFTSRTNWTYQLEETSNLNDWSATGGELEGTGETIDLPITRADPFVFTRIRATRK